MEQGLRLTRIIAFTDASSLGKVHRPTFGRRLLYSKMWCGDTANVTTLNQPPTACAVAPLCIWPIAASAAQRRG